MPVGSRDVAPDSCVGMELFGSRALSATGGRSCYWSTKLAFRRPSTTDSKSAGCVSACKIDPLRGVIGVQN